MPEIDDYDPAVWQAPRTRPLRRILLTALIAFVAGGALVTWALTHWAPARRLIVSGQVTSAPARVASTPVTPPALHVAPLDPQAISVTESRVAGLEARLAQIDTQASLASANAARAEGLLIAFAARRAIDRGASLGYLEDRLRTRFATTQPRAVAAIIAAAQNPVTLDTLRQQLDLLTPGLAGAVAQESWWDATKRTMGALMVVRRADTPSPAADERIARARRAIDGGQVENALAEVARLPTRNAANDWMTASRRYIEAHRALDILEASALIAPQSTTASTS